MPPMNSAVSTARDSAGTALDSVQHPAVDQPVLSDLPARNRRRVKHHAIERAEDEKINRIASIPFFFVHALCLLAFVTGVTPTAIVLFLVMFWGRMFFITAGYHRYFSHRSYKMGRPMQLVMAFGGAM